MLLRYLLDAGFLDGRLRVIQSVPPLRIAEDRTPTCFLHVGTHKTGTTSVQNLLTANERMFAERGLYVPRSGRSEERSGHHNLAWELNDDRRFDAARGTLADTLREIAEHRSPRVCLTSEDFEYLHDRPHELRQLADGLGRIGYRAAVIVFLRPQADYAESLYAELVKHGLRLPFDAFLDTIVATGEFVFNDRWRFTFDYERLLDDFAATFGPAQIIARRYQGYAGDIVADFLELIGVAGSELRERIAQPRRLNAGLRFADVLTRFELNARSTRRSDDVPAIPRLRRVGGRFDPVHLREASRIVERFNAGNRRVAERYGALVPCVSGRDLVADLAAASGIDPVSRYRKGLVDIYAPLLAGPARPPIGDAPASVNMPVARADESAARLQFTWPARAEAIVVLTAVLGALAAFSFGRQSASTTLVEFGLLCTIFAGSSAGQCARYIAKAHGVIADDRFFEIWGVRLRTFAYAVVGLYALVNALLDVGLPRYSPDWISYPGTIATGAATLVVALVVWAKRRLPSDGGRADGPSLSDHQFFIACGCVALLVEMAHAVAPDWWLDTCIDLAVVGLAGIKMRAVLRSAADPKRDAIA
jgi:hypothetical protein